jgi:hypothetical protein
MSNDVLLCPKCRSVLLADRRGVVFRRLRRRGMSNECEECGPLARGLPDGQDVADATWDGDTSCV